MLKPFNQLKPGDVVDVTLSSTGKLVAATVVSKPQPYNNGMRNMLRLMANVDGKSIPMLGQLTGDQRNVRG